MLWFIAIALVVIFMFTKAFWDSGELLGALVGGFALLMLGIFGLNIAAVEAKTAFCNAPLIENLPVCGGVPSWQRHGYYR